MTKKKDPAVDVQGAYQRVLTGSSGQASEIDRFAVLHDLTYRYDYFFVNPDRASDEELREANAARKVVMRILQQSHQPGSDLLSRLFEAAVARRIDEQQPKRMNTDDDA